MPSAVDFLLHEMPKIIDALSADYLSATLPVDDVADVRMLITKGLMVTFIVVYVMVAADGASRFCPSIWNVDEGLRAALTVAADVSRMYQFGEHRAVSACIRP